MKIRSSDNIKALAVICVCLVLTLACSSEENPAGFVEQTIPAAEAADIESSQLQTGSEESGQAVEDSADEKEVLSSLDDLLPHQFSELTSEWHGDLDGMIERRIMRVLVVGDGPLFFYYRGKPRGIVAELLVRMQKQLNTKLGRRIDQIEILPMPVSRDRLIPTLIDGGADLVAADLTITGDRAELVDFSIPLARHIDEVVVFAHGEGGGVHALDDLAGLTIYVRESSSYFEHLVSLNEDLTRRALEPIEIVNLNELLRTQDILEMVNAGLIPATVVDGYKASNWSEIFSKMQVRDDLVIHADGEIAWLFRKDSPQLAAAVNDFMKEHRAGTLIGNVLINRYMGNLQWIRNATSDEALERLQPMLQLFHASAAESNLDTLMLVAQAYQESQLDQSKVSRAGAMGIMQIKPSTAADKHVGVKNISTPADNIRAGARYMRFLMDRYFSGPEVDELHQWMFALAAYNAGPDRVRRMRKQAEAEGHDPNIWLENVEIVAARQIGHETSRYVRNVFKYYVAYRMSWELEQMRHSTDPPARAPETGSP